MQLQMCPSFPAVCLLLRVLTSSKFHLHISPCADLNTLTCERYNMTLENVASFTSKPSRFLSQRRSLIWQLSSLARQLSPDNASKPVLGCGVPGPTPLPVLQPWYRAGQGRAG
jgi:hypothetical protein